MPKINRMFEIIQTLRRSPRAMTCAEIARQLEVSERTVYRDISALQATGVPVWGEAGVGYVLGKDYDLPEVNFTSDEVEALRIALALVNRTGDTRLIGLAQRASLKLLPEDKGAAQILVSQGGVPDGMAGLSAQIREAIAHSQQMRLTYVDEAGQNTTRDIWPIVLIYYPQTVVVAAKCLLRGAIRHFRLDRIKALNTIPISFAAQAEELRGEWHHLHKLTMV